MRSVTPEQLRNLTAPERQQKAAQLIPNRNCVVCRHPQRGQMEGDWVAGKSVRQLAEEYRSISYATMLSHWSNQHPVETLGAAFMDHYAARQLMDRINGLLDEVEDVFAKARQDGNEKLAIQTADRLTRLLELRGKASGEIKPDGATVTLLIQQSEEWALLRETILGALSHYPAALHAVREALAATDHAAPEDGIVEAEFRMALPPHEEPAAEPTE